LGEILARGAGDSRTAEATRPARAVWKPRDQLRRDERDGGDHELSDSIPMPNLEGRVATVAQDDLDLPTVVGLDRPRTGRDRSPLPQSQATARTNLELPTLGDSHRPAARDQRPRSRSQAEHLPLVEAGAKIEPRARLAHPPRQDRLGMDARDREARGFDRPGHNRLFGT